MARVTNKEMSGYTRRREPFQNKGMSCFGKWQLPSDVCWGDHDPRKHVKTHPEALFVVTSTYGVPLYVWAEEAEKWFGNDAIRYKHINSQLQAHLRASAPRGVDIQWVDETTMKDIVALGVVRAVQRKFGGAT